MKTIDKTIITQSKGKDTFEAVVFYSDGTWAENWGFQTEDEARRWSEAIIKES